MPDVFPEMPPTLPIFPLTGALLLPGGQLPLNIFEPRYLDMVRDSMAGERLIGMIQPREVASDAAKSPPLYTVGCAGKITDFSETDDGRYLITLRGVGRFKVLEELTCTTAYRQVRPDFSDFDADLRNADEAGTVDRDSLLGSLQRYLEARDLSADWDAIKKAPDEILVNSLAMICPFSPAEKQALLEAENLCERAKTMTAVMDFSLTDDEDGPSPAH